MPQENSMNWVFRFSIHTKAWLNPAVDSATAVRQKFSVPAWRLLYRSGRQSFLPILRRQELKLKDLVDYVESLVSHGWQLAPPARLLETLIHDSYGYFDNCPAVPTKKSQLDLLRVAARDREVGLLDFRLVCRWRHDPTARLTDRTQWTSLVRRARAWEERQGIEAKETAAQWFFPCGTVDWRGLELIPLRTPLELWDEGRAMSHCAYDLRRSCDGVSRARLFSVRRRGTQLATLELAWNEPAEEMLHMDRVLGRWELRDCRLSCNRLPTSSLLTSMTDFARLFNTWSQKALLKEASTPLRVSAGGSSAALIHRRLPSATSRTDIAAMI